MNIAFIRDRWIPALKSGEFTQGHRFLHTVDTNTHCCWGVACELVKDELHLNTMEYGAPDRAVTAFGASHLHPPPMVRDFVGLPSLVVYVLEDLNDSSDSYEPAIAYLEQRIAEEMAQNPALNAFVE